MTIINVCNLFAPIDWNNKYSYSYYILSETPAVVYQYEKNVSKFSSDLTQLHCSRTASVTGELQSQVPVT